MSVLIETSFGDLVIDLFVKKCPMATQNFLKLCKIKFYNNALFFDVQKNYIARVTHPINQPTTIYEQINGEQQKYFNDELYTDLKHNKIGLVATSNKAPNMNDSNFYITMTNENLEYLNTKHTIFGQIAEGLDVLDKINNAFLDEKNRPLKNIRILHTFIIDDPFPDPDQIPIVESPNLLRDDRLEVDEEIDILEKDGRTEEQLMEATRDHEAKTKAIVLEMINDIPDADIKPPDNVLFICKLNPATQEKDLELIFSKFGTIRNCEVIRDWKTGQSLQYAFIEFETNAACEEAFFKMENTLIDERRIHIDFSQSVAKLWPKYRKGNKSTTVEETKEKIEIKQKKRFGDDKYDLLFVERDKNKTKNTEKNKEDYLKEKNEVSNNENKERQSFKKKSKSRSRSRSERKRRSYRDKDRYGYDSKPSPENSKKTNKKHRSRSRSSSSVSRDRRNKKEKERKKEKRY